MREVSISMIALMLSLPTAAAEEAAQFQLDHAQKRVISLSRLYEDDSCPKAQVKGLVVKREFAPNALKVTGFVVEGADGRRQHVNVDVNPDDMNMNQRGWVLVGLQSLLKEGRQIDGVMRLCGAAGRVTFLESVR